MRVHEMLFRERMAAHEQKKKKAAEQKERETDALLRDLTPEEEATLKVALQDEIVVEAWRREAWRHIGATDAMIPRTGWPKEVASAEEFFRLFFGPH